MITAHLKYLPLQYFFLLLKIWGLTLLIRQPGSHGITLNSKQFSKFNLLGDEITSMSHPSCQAATLFFHKLRQKHSLNTVKCTHGILKNR